MSGPDQAETKRRAERVGAVALLLLIPAALVAFAVDGVVLLVREGDYQREAAERAASVGAAAAASVASALGSTSAAPATASASASAGPAASASAAVTAGKR